MKCHKHLSRGLGSAPMDLIWINMHPDLPFHLAQHKSHSDLFYSSDHCLCNVCMSLQGELGRYNCVHNMCIPYQLWTAATLLYRIPLKYSFDDSGMNSQFLVWVVPTSHHCAATIGCKGFFSEMNVPAFPIPPPSKLSPYGKV